MDLSTGVLRHSKRGIFMNLTTILACTLFLLIGGCGKDGEGDVTGNEDRKPVNASATTATNSEAPNKPLVDAGSAGNSAKTDNEMIRELVLNEMVEVTSAPLDSPALKRVSEARFYRVTLKIHESKDAYSKSEYPFGFDGTNWVRIEMATGNRKMPLFKGLLSTKVRLKNKDDAEVMEAALDVLFPIHDGDEKKKSIRQQASGWIFVRGEFFDDQSGFIVTTDKDGAIMELEYSLEIKQ